MILKQFSPCDWTIFRRFFTGEMVLYWGHCKKVISYHYRGYSVYPKLFNIKLTWVVRGMMVVLHVYYFKSVGISKHKWSRIES